MIRIPHLSTVSPFSGANFKRIDPIIGGAAIKGIGSVVGGFLGLKGTKDTNKTNYKIAQEYNANQVRLAQMQNQWNIEQRDYMNAYNSPEQQMERFKAAGINPYMALSQMSAGNQESALTSAQPNTAPPPQMQAPDYSFVSNAFSDAIGAAASLADTKMKNEQTKGFSLDNRYKYDSFSDRLKKLGADTDMASLGAKMLRETYQNQIEISDINVQMQRQALANARAQQFNIEADTSWKKAQTGLTNTQAEKMQYEIDFKLPQEIDNLRKQGKLLDQKILSEMVNRSLMRANIGLMSQQAEEIRRCIPYKVAGLEAANDAAALANNYSAASFNSRLLEQLGKGAAAGRATNEQGFTLGIPGTPFKLAFSTKGTHDYKTNYSEPEWFQYGDFRKKRYNYDVGQYRSH